MVQVKMNFKKELITNEQDKEWLWVGQWAIQFPRIFGRQREEGD
jgi:hypothetical protein